MFCSSEQIVDAAEQDDDIRIFGDVLITVDKGIVVIAAIKGRASDTQIDDLGRSIFGNKICIAQATAVGSQSTTASGGYTVA